MNHILDDIDRDELAQLRAEHSDLVARGFYQSARVVSGRIDAITGEGE